MSIQNTNDGMGGGTSLTEDNTRHKHSEEELRRSHAELQAIYEHVPILICVLDTSRQVLYANRAFAEFVGKPVTELKGERACGVLGCLRALDNPQGCGHGPHCATCPVRLAMVDTFTTGKSHRSIEYRTTILHEGTPLEMVFLASIAALQLSGHSSLLLCLEDITEREKAQMALRKSEVFARTVLDSLSAHIAVLDEQGVIVAVNEAWRRFLLENDGKDPLMYVGANYVMVCQSASNQHGDTLARAAFEGIQAVTQGSRESFEMVYPCHSPAERRWFLMRVCPLEGQSGGVVVSHENITQRKEVEEALRESEKCFRELVTASANPILVVQYGRYVFANPASLRLLGYAESELNGMDALAIVDPALRGQVRQRLQQASSGHPNPVIELRTLRKDGSFIITQSVSVPILYNGLPAVLITSQDITDRKAAEDRLLQEMVHVQDLAQTNARLLALSREHSEHLRQMATRASEIEENERKRLATELHDRVGPGLTALGLSLSVLRENVQMGRGDSGLSRLDDCRKLVEEIADITRNVMSELRPPLLDEYGLADALDWLCTRFAERSHLEIITDLNKTMSRLEPAKELDLFRITQEALTNVVKHAGARRAYVSWQRKDGQVVLEIRDEGTGFDPNELRACPRPGGLGLLSMRERALAIGAELCVDSALGKGTRIVVALPR